LQRIRITVADSSPFLELVDIPWVIKRRSNLRKFLFLRECYAPLLEEITATLPRLLHKTVAVLGTGGIGKSAFLLYCIHRLRQDPAVLGVTTRSFYHQDEPGIVNFYTHQADKDVYEVSEITNSRSLNPGIPMFADLLSPTLPMEHSGPCLIFSSFNPPRYKGLVKLGGCCKVMPTWPQEEFSAYLASAQFESDFSAEIAQRAYGNGRYFGGAIRPSLIYAMQNKDPAVMIDSEIRTRGADVCRRYFGGTISAADSDDLDLLVHRNPSRHGGFEAEALVCSFASPYVLQRLVQLNAELFAGEIKRRYAVGRCDSGDGNERSLPFLAAIAVDTNGGSSSAPYAQGKSPDKQATRAAETSK
jgi:hypothetical protein